MIGKPIGLLCVGKLKTPFWREAAEHYVRRISRMRRLVCREVRDADAALPLERRMEVEGQRLLECCGAGDALLAMDERGTSLTSCGLAELLGALDAGIAGSPAFAVGGAYGLDRAILDRAHKVVSLSAMTFPHEMARIVLLEQLYRSLCILGNSPYHH